MTTPSTFDFWNASNLAYGESEAGGAENQTGTAREQTLLDDQLEFLFQKGITGWNPIDVSYIPSDGFYGVAYLTSAGQVIISFEGTVLGTSSFARATLSEDYSIYKQQRPQALSDAE